MQLKPSILATALLLALGGTAAAAERPQRGEGPRHERTPIVIAEARERAIERAAAMDTDGDGYISMEERLAFHESQRAERMARMMERRGIDPEARIAVEDFVARRVAWLEKLDANGDGIVDAEELAAARDGHRQRRGMHGKAGEQRRKRGD
jgi:hypothetical protein